MAPQSAFRGRAVSTIITLGRSNDSRLQNEASPSLNSGTT